MTARDGDCLTRHMTDTSALRLVAFLFSASFKYNLVFVLFFSTRLYAVQRRD